MRSAPRETPGRHHRRRRRGRRTPRSAPQSCSSRAAPPSGPFVPARDVAVLRRPAGAVPSASEAPEPVADASRGCAWSSDVPGWPTFAYREYRVAVRPPRPRHPPIAPARSAAALPAAPGSRRRRHLRLDSRGRHARVLPRRSSRATARAASYLAALREANPALALARSDAIPFPRRPPIALARPAHPVQPARRPAARRLRCPGAVSAPSPRTRSHAVRAAAPLPREPRDPGSRREREKAAPPPSRRPARDRRQRAPGEIRLRTFSLKLSAPEVDLTRSRGIDDAQRAEPRAAAGARRRRPGRGAPRRLRDSLKRLEAPRRGAAAQALGNAARFATACRRREPSPPRPGGSREDSNRRRKLRACESRRPESRSPPRSSRRTPEAVAASQGGPPKVAPPKAEARGKPSTRAARSRCAPARHRAAEDGLPAWLWGVVAAARASRHSACAWSILRAPPAAADGQRTMTLPGSSRASRARLAVPRGRTTLIAERDREAGAPVARAARELDSDAGLATEVPSGDPAELRRRYIEERFPEIANGTIVARRPRLRGQGRRGSSTRTAPLPRAVELLQFATEENPARAEALARALRDLPARAPQGPSSPTSRSASATARPRSELAQGAVLRPRDRPGQPALPRPLGGHRDHQVRGRRAAGRRSSFDPVAENWLNAPMDFENEVLANDLRRALMDEARRSPTRTSCPTRCRRCAASRCSRSPEAWNAPPIPSTSSACSQQKSVREATARALFLAAIRELGKEGGRFTLERLRAAHAHRGALPGAAALRPARVPAPAVRR